MKRSAATTSVVPLVVPVTVTSTVPVPVGATAVIEEALEKTTVALGVAPNLTVSVLSKPVPVIVTNVLALPAVGLTAVTDVKELAEAGEVETSINPVANSADVAPRATTERNVDRTDRCPLLLVNVLFISYLP